MKTIRKTQQVQRKANPPNTTSQKPQSKKAVSSPSTRVNQSPKVLTPTLHLVLVHFNGDDLIGLHYRGGIWVFQNEICRIFGIDQNLLEERDFSDDSRAVVVIPRLDGGLSEVVLISLSGLYLFVRNTEQAFITEKDIYEKVHTMK